MRYSATPPPYIGRVGVVRTGSSSRSGTSPNPIVISAVPGSAGRRGSSGSSIALATRHPQSEEAWVGSALSTFIPTQEGTEYDALVQRPPVLVFGLARLVGILRPCRGELLQPRHVEDAAGEQRTR